MSYFSMPAIGGQDIKKVYNYIRLLNEQLQYCFTSISPEDNFDLESLIKYQETETNIALLEVTMGGFISQFKNLQTDVESSIKVLNGQIALKVSVGELCSEISATTDTITFKTGYLIIDSKNFKLYADGTAEFSGKITGGSIDINGRFTVDPSGIVHIDSTTFSRQITTNGLLYTNYMRIGGDASIEGEVSCTSMHVSGDVTCETLTETSDVRLKHDIQEIPDETSLRVVLGMRPVTYAYKDSDVRSMGYIAQDIDRLLEDLDIDLPLVDHTRDYLSIPYGTDGVLYAGAIRQQQKELDDLENRIRKLEEIAA